MKRILVLLCAALILCLTLCSCMNTSAGRVEDKATEAVSKMRPTENNDRKNVADNTEAVKQTEDDSNLMETIVDAVATEWDDMVEDGEVEDGDGNVGDRENKDGDGIVAHEDE